MTIYDMNINATPTLRPDIDILADIWEGIWHVDTIRSTDMHSLSIAVLDSAVTLAGHLSLTFNRSHIENIARSVRGVSAVHNHLVVDSALNLEVAQALASDTHTRLYLLPVGSHHGWVHLGGAVPSREVQATAEAVAASVPSVRGVIVLPRIIGQPSTPVRRAVQPGPGARVYAEDHQAGGVTQVIINPRNRLVTHMVVSLKKAVETDDLIGFKDVTGHYLIPIEAAEIVNDEIVILQSQPRSISAYPLFEAEAYPSVPATWQPPYPYSPNTVRWSQKEPQTALAIRAVPGTSQIEVQARRERAEDRAIAGVRPTPGLPTLVTAND